MMATRIVHGVIDAATVVVVLAGYAAFLWVTRALWQVPSGSDIDTRGMAGAMFMLGIATPVATMVVSGAAPDRPRSGKRSASISEVATAASLGVLGLTFFYIPLVARIRGRHLGP